MEADKAGKCADADSIVTAMKAVFAARSTFMFAVLAFAVLAFANVALGVALSSLSLGTGVIGVVCGVVNAPLLVWLANRQVLKSRR